MNRRKRVPSNNKPTKCYQNLDPLNNEKWFPKRNDYFSGPIFPEKIYSTTESLRNITDILYHEIQRDFKFPELSHSAFAYYLANLTYVRLLEVYNSNLPFKLTSNEKQYIQVFNIRHYVYPEVFARYLSGFGNTDLLNLELQFEMLPRPSISAGGLNGWFGKINADTHYLYKHYPCIAVFAQRILEDLKYTKKHEEVQQERGKQKKASVEIDDTWDLPTAIRPEGDAKITENLQGFRKAQKLSATQVQFLQKAGITCECFSMDNPEISFNRTLMYSVSAMLQRIPRRSGRPSGRPTSMDGSRGQIPYIKTSESRNLDENIETELTFEGHSIINPGQAGFAGMSFAYRILHNKDDQNWSIYKFKNGVPPDWVQTINVFRDSEVPELQISRFKTGEWQINDNIRDFVTAVRENMIRNPSRNEPENQYENKDPLNKMPLYPKYNNFCRSLYLGKIYSGTEGLRSITNILYDEIEIYSRYPFQRVSHSAFAYYLANLTYARLLEVYDFNRNLNSSNENLYVQQINDGYYAYPEVFARYLAGFGNTYLLSLNVKFEMLPRPSISAGGLNGWFGKVNAETHHLYKHYPCIAVFAQRILEDLKYTKTCVTAHQERNEKKTQIKINGAWDLPPAIRPESDAEITENLQGFQKAQTLSASQVQFLQEAGITCEHFSMDNSEISFNQALMNKVSMALQCGTVSPIKCTSRSRPTSVHGSRGQTSYIKTCSLNEGIETKSEFEGHSITKPDLVDYVGMSFAYRILHNKDALNWSIYKFKNGVPPDWVQTINVLRDLEVPELQLTRFTSDIHLDWHIRNFVDAERIPIKYDDSSSDDYADDYDVEKYCFQ